jgi:hypothetical protein
MVKTVNMPSTSSDPYHLPKADMKRALALAKRPPQKPRPVRDPKGDDQDKKAAAAKRTTVKALTAEAIAQRPPEPLSEDLAKDSAEHMASAWPTYEVHAFHDTGKTIIYQGRKYTLVEPQVPFGYYVDHDGALQGFEHALEGLEGAQFTALSSDYYKVSVKNGGYAKIKTTITAVEPGSESGCPCESCCKAPPVKVEIKPRCYCAAPGLASSGGVSTLAGLFGLLGALYFRRRRSAR